MSQPDADLRGSSLMLRMLRREVQDFPATIAFCLLWILVFAAMTATYLAEGNPLPFLH
jgi:hypothetical protein